MAGSAVNSIGQITIVLILLVAIATPAFSEDLIVNFSRQSRASIATAIERNTAVNVAGEIDGNQVRFSNLQPKTPYDLAIELGDGALYCGADLSWCDPSPADPQAEPLGDDDRQQIGAIVTDILGFADKPKLIMLQGSHDRAVGLVDLTRTKGFHSDKGNEVIWRVEVWFFKWENGGWERVADQSRLLRRERFASNDAYLKETARLHWSPELGGIQLHKGASPIKVTVRLTTTAITPPTTKASSSPAESRPGIFQPPP